MTDDRLPPEAVDANLRALDYVRQNPCSRVMIEWSSDRGREVRIRIRGIEGANVVELLRTP